MTVWPDPPASWTNIDRYPDSDSKAKAYDALARLNELSPDSVSAERDNYDRDAVPFLRFDIDAQGIFDAWREDLETRLRGSAEHPAIESHLAKYRSLIPSIALIVHLLDGGSGPVNSEAITKAIGWGEYLESHARRLYASVTDAPAMSARLLAARIQKGDVPDLFASHKVYRSGWAGLDKHRTEAAIDVLLSLDWLEERVEPTAGRNRIRYAINPKIEISHKDEPKKPKEDPSFSNFSSPLEDIGNSEPGDLDAYEAEERAAMQTEGM
jgi:putative DNA primase/helicase